ELQRRGYAPDEARRLAGERFGDVGQVKWWLRRHDWRRLQRQRRGEIMDELMQDLRYGARKLIASPGFTLAVVAVLALGAGATTAIFSAVDAALLRPLPFAASDRLISLSGISIPMEQSPFPQSSAGPVELR